MLAVTVRVCRLRSISWLLGGALALVASRASADVPGPNAPSAPAPLPQLARGAANAPRPDPYLTFRYRQPAEPDMLRALFEGLGVLGLGYVEYLAATHQVSPGGRLFFDGGIFYDKVSGNAQSFDANQFGTNFLGHPFGGTLYYLAARSNRLTIPQSFAWALTGSLLWEYFGEIREKPSINDMVTTPWGGFANGETFIQFAAFFSRGRRTVHGQVLELVFGLPRVTHDAIDGVTPEPAESTDALGFPNDIAHDFRARFGAGSTFQQGIGKSGAGEFEGRFALDAELKNLASYGRAGDESRVYDDGNIAAMHVRLAQSDGHVVDGLYEAKVSPIGYYRHKARVDERGRLFGQSTIVGLTVGYEYGAHDYDRDRRRPVDVIGKITVLGLLAEHVAYLGGARVRTRLEIGGDFAGVRAYGLPAYLERNPTAPTPPPAEAGNVRVDLPYILRNEGYYFAAGPSIIPSVAVELDPVELAARLRIDDYRGILGLDVDQTKLTRDVARSDRRIVGSVRASARITSGIEVGAELEARRREGRVGDIHDARTQRTIVGFLGARF